MGGKKMWVFIEKLSFLLVSLERYQLRPIYEW